MAGRTLITGLAVLATILQHVTAQTARFAVIAVDTPVSGVESWTTAEYGVEFAEAPVVACSLRLDPPALDASPYLRLRNVGSTSFEVLTRVAGGPSLDSLGVSMIFISCLVAAEGVYTEATDGVKMEVHTIEVTSVDSGGSRWIGVDVGYDQSYVDPTVIGSIQTHNDDGFQTFWARGGKRTAPPSDTELFVGRHIGEDPDRTRDPETVGYIVVETGSFDFDGVVGFADQVGPSVTGVEMDLTQIVVTDSGLTAPVFVTVSECSMRGNNGQWMVSAGDVTATGFAAYALEDQLGDLERAHLPENICFMMFEVNCHPACLDSCTVADDPAACTGGCDADLGYREDSEGACVCSSSNGFTDGSSDNCVCDVSRGLEASGTECICSAELGFMGVAPNCAPIASCHPSCLNDACSASDDASACLEGCDSSLGFILSGGSCVCDAATGHTASGDSCVCDSPDWTGSTGACTPTCHEACSGSCVAPDDPEACRDGCNTFLGYIQSGLGCAFNCDPGCLNDACSAPTDPTACTDGCDTAAGYSLNPSSGACELNCDAACADTCTAALDATACVGGCAEGFGIITASDPPVGCVALTCSPICIDDTCTASDDPAACTGDCAAGYVKAGDGAVGCLLDSDSDGIADEVDNCPTVSNADQANSDGDEFVSGDSTTGGDACDTQLDCPAACATACSVPDSTDPSTCIATSDADCSSGFVYNTASGSGCTDACSSVCALGMCLSPSGPDQCTGDAGTRCIDGWVAIDGGDGCEELVDYSDTTVVTSTYSTATSCADVSPDTSDVKSGVDSATGGDATVTVTDCTEATSGSIDGGRRLQFSFALFFTVAVTVPSVPTASITSFIGSGSTGGLSIPSFGGGFASFGSSSVSVSSSCHENCLTCSGPGINQCQTCVDGTSFVSDAIKACVPPETLYACTATDFFTSTSSLVTVNPTTGQLGSIIGTLNLKATTSFGASTPVSCQGLARDPSSGRIVAVVDTAPFTDGGVYFGTVDLDTAEVTRINTAALTKEFTGVGFTCSGQMYGVTKESSFGFISFSTDAESFFTIDKTSGSPYFACSVALGDIGETMSFVGDSLFHFSGSSFPTMSSLNPSSLGVGGCTRTSVAGYGFSAPLVLGGRSVRGMAVDVTGSNRLIGVGSSGVFTVSETGSVTGLALSLTTLQSVAWNVPDPACAGTTPGAVSSSSAFGAVAGASVSGAAVTTPVVVVSPSSSPSPVASPAGAAAAAPVAPSTEASPSPSTSATVVEEEEEASRGSVVDTMAEEHSSSSSSSSSTGTLVIVCSVASACVAGAGVMAVLARRRRVSTANRLKLRTLAIADRKPRDLQRGGQAWDGEFQLMTARPPSATQELDEEPSSRRRSRSKSRSRSLKARSSSSSGTKKTKKTKKTTSKSLKRSKSASKKTKKLRRVTSTATKSRRHKRSVKSFSTQ